MLYLICLLALVAGLLVIAFTTLLERKLLASIQRRRAPSLHNVVGLIQPIFDGVKLALKGNILATATLAGPFILPLGFMLFLVFALFGTLPTFGVTLGGLGTIAWGALCFLLAASGLAVCIVIVTMVTTNAWTRLGSLRVMLAILSYELVFAGLLTMAALCWLGWSFGGAGNTWAGWSGWAWLPLWGLATLADLGRAPIDIGEAESELVSGVNTEHAGLGFAVFFLGEYGHTVAAAGLLGAVFGGSGWTGPLVALLAIVGIIAARGAFPRVRVDQLLRVAWSWGLPAVGIGVILCIAGTGVDWSAISSHIPGLGNDPPDLC